MKTFDEFFKTKDRTDEEKLILALITTIRIYDPRQTMEQIYNHHINRVVKTEALMKDAFKK